MTPLAINPKTLPAPSGYSHGTLAGNTLHLGGQTTLGPGMKIVPGGIVEQFRQAFSNVLTTLPEAGGPGQRDPRVRWDLVAALASRPASSLAWLPSSLSPTANRGCDLRQPPRPGGWRRAGGRLTRRDGLGVRSCRWQYLGSTMAGISRSTTPRIYGMNGWRSRGCARTSFLDRLRWLPIVGQMQLPACGFVAHRSAA
jgi:hypothetical protein